jgi:cell division control protein 45
MDFRFILLRHWTLFNSIKYSPYMVAKLRLWDDYGINKMKDFIIQIGVSL